MITFRAGYVWHAGHAWLEMYVRMPRNRTLFAGWTRRLGGCADIIDEPYRAVTRRL